MYVPTQKCLGVSGLGCVGCDGKCGGLGLFESGIDISQWGWQEWGLALLGGYVVMSVVSTTSRVGRSAGRAYQGVKRSAKRRSARSERKRELQEELRGL